jgi:hypothetical protein
MLLFSFGILGDFVYYFTKDYLDPSLLENNLELSNYLIKDGITYKELQEIKCNLSQWEEFKNNKKKYFEMLKKLQTGINDNWQTTDLNQESTKEDISNIKDDFFSTPHFKLWFDIENSIGNLSQDLTKQNLIGKAVMNVKSINSVFDGVVGYFNATLGNLYLIGYPRFKKHISLISDGYADFWN